MLEHRFISVGSTLLALMACADEKSAAEATTQAIGTATSPSPIVATAAPSKPRTLPELRVEDDAIYLGGDRIDLRAEDGALGLEKLLSRLPVAGPSVAVVAAKKARTKDVALFVSALGRAGAERVVIKTDGRSDLPRELAFTPRSRVDKAPGCSIVTELSNDLSSSIWSVKGGVARRQRKGLAGPDFSQTGELLKKDLASCDSSMAFVAAEDSVAWELVHNLAGTVKISDEKKRIDILVLLETPPVAGRPVAELNK